VVATAGFIRGAVLAHLERTGIVAGGVGTVVIFMIHQNYNLFMGAGAGAKKGFSGLILQLLG
jgi:hypothetical protein